MTWDSDTYAATIRAEIHDYDELQAQVVRATAGMSPATILDLGVGGGETASRVLQMHPRSRLIGIDSSADMLRGAGLILPRDRVTLVNQDLADPLPDERCDLVISALAIHHLDGSRKATLFRSVAERLTSRGRFVMGDVIVPERDSDALIEIEAGYDFPSSVEEQVTWMTDAGLTAEVVWLRQDLAVFKAEPLGR
ncbi:MAG: methyltransferase domain-containing protein [Actinobacteria bacterium]|nr:methyltransferase domain-containing protein [Actinomycetota bacterium]